MTQEYKKLLLQDLCSRLPYGVIVQAKALGGITTEGILWFIEYDKTRTFIFLHKGSLLGYNINEDIIKPYLRPMSSMTDLEHQDWIKYSKADYDCEFQPEPTLSLENCHLSVDWLNAHHFDYRDLIPKGLAIKVTKENNPYEKK